MVVFLGLETFHSGLAGLSHHHRGPAILLVWHLYVRLEEEPHPLVFQNEAIFAILYVVRIDVYDFAALSAFGREAEIALPCLEDVYYGDVRIFVRLIALGGKGPTWLASCSVERTK